MVAGIARASSRRRMRSTPTFPNSPREIMLGDVAAKGPNQIDRASKSKVKQTVAAGAFSIGAPQSIMPGSTVARYPAGPATLAYSTVQSDAVRGAIEECD